MNLMGKIGEINVLVGDELQEPLCGVNRCSMG